MFGLLNPKFTYPSRIDSLQQYKLSNFCFVTESLTFIAGTHSFPALDNWYNLGAGKSRVETYEFNLVMWLNVTYSFFYLGSNWPVNPGDTLLDNAPDLLEYIGVLLVHPVSQVTAVIKDLTGNTYHLLKSLCVNKETQLSIINTEKPDIPQWSHGRMYVLCNKDFCIFVCIIHTTLQVPC